MRASAFLLKPAASFTAGPELSVRQLNSIEDLTALRALWKAWQRHPNADIDQFRLVCETRSEVQQPLVLLLQSKGEALAMLVARIERSTIAPRIGYLRLFGVPATVISVLHQGIIGNVDEPAAQALLLHLQALLAGQAADMVVLHQVAESSAVHAAAQSISPSCWWEPKTQWTTHRSMSVPQGTDVLLGKLRAKHRSSLRSRSKALEALAPTKVRWSWMSSFEDIPALSRQLEAVAALTYQRGLGAGFFDDQEHRSRLDIFARSGELRVQLLEVEGRPCAFWLGSVLGDTFHSWATGYSPAVASFDAGTLTLAKVLDNLAQEGVKVFDFGLGDAHYKARFGDHSWREASVRIYAADWRGTVLRCLVGGFDLVDRVARRTLSALGGFDKLRTAWRRRVRGVTAPRAADESAPTDA